MGSGQVGLAQAEERGLPAEELGANGASEGPLSVEELSRESDMRRGDVGSGQAVLPCTGERELPEGGLGAVIVASSEISSSVEGFSGLFEGRLLRRESTSSGEKEFAGYNGKREVPEESLGG